MKTILARVAAPLCALACSIPAGAQAQAASDWQFQGTIYGYLPSVGGKTSFPPSGGGDTAVVDVTDILDLKFAFMGSLEARKGLWGVYTDFVYVDLGDSVSGTRNFSIGGALPAGASANVNYDLKGWLWTLAGTWRATATPAFTLDVLGGARMLKIEQSVDWQLAGNIGSVSTANRAGSRNTEDTNWDAIIGVKGRAALGSGGKWFAPYYLDIGAGDSKLTWQAMGGVGYSFSWGDVVGVWRYIDYEMKSGQPTESLDFNGPALAAVFRW